LGVVRPNKVKCQWRPVALPKNGWENIGGIMPLKQQIAERKAQESTLRRNPEIDAKLDRFIQANPKMFEYYQGLSKDELIRKQMLGKMQRSEFSERRNQEIAQWVEEHPDIKAKVEERIKNVPAEKRERAYINAAKTVAMSEGMRTSNGITP
jgi:hypothetical protein